LANTIVLGTELQAAATFLVKLTFTWGAGLPTGWFSVEPSPVNII
jgi:hypothetical protein